MGLMNKVQSRGRRRATSRHDTPGIRIRIEKIELLAKVIGERVVLEPGGGWSLLAAALRAALRLRTPIATLIRTPAAGVACGPFAARAADLRFAAALGAERDTLAHEIDLEHAHAQLVPDFDDLVRVFDEAIGELRHMHQAILMYADV